jgi:hypothetical protein
MPKQRKGLLRRSCRGRRTGHRHTRVPQELGTPCRFLLDNDWLSGVTKPKNSGPQVGVGLGGETKTGARAGQGLAKETKWDPTGGRESERSIVPLKPGNACRADPAEERGRLVAEPWPGNSAGALNLDTLSPQRPRVAQRTSVRDETSRMREIRTYGSAGALGGNSQGDPARFPVNKNVRVQNGINLSRFLLS